MAGTRFLECCCTSVHDALEAEKGGASRIELCENLEVGGVTPSLALTKDVLSSVKIPVNILIRSRSGDFVFSDAEIDGMVDSISQFKQLGVNAIVVGALRLDGSVDVPAMRRLIDAARPLPVTFHRAFDVCSNPLEAFEEIKSLGCERLLTSGQEADSLTGAPLIAKLVAKSEGRITVLVGGGVRPSNIVQIEKITGAVEFHSSSPGPDGRTSAATVSELVNNS